MAFDSEKLLEVARVLLSESLATVDTEARYRSAIGRAYYAVFLRARFIVERDGGRVRGAGENSHNDVWDFLEADTGGNGISLCLQGKRLKQKRQQADYRLDLTVRISDANRAIVDAEQLLADLDALAPVAPPR